MSDGFTSDPINVDLQRIVEINNCEPEVVDDVGLEAKDEKPKNHWTLMAKKKKNHWMSLKNMNGSTCIGLDKALLIVAVGSRTVVDLLHDCLWWSKSIDESRKAKNKNKGWSKKNKNKNKGSPSVDDEEMIDGRRGGRSAPSNLIKWFRYIKMLSQRSSVEARAIAMMASIPLPQVVILAVGLQSHFMAWLKFGLVCQFVPRILRICPCYVAATINTSPDIYALVAAASNVLLFALASHSLGGFWYLRSVERKMDCMEQACRGQLGCSRSFLYCESGNHTYNEPLSGTCGAQPTINATIPFDYGMYRDAIVSDLVGSSSWIVKIAGSFWWGINSLSSTGLNIVVGTYILDVCFAVFICFLGLILYALLIANSQTYVQSTASTSAKLKEKREELQNWLPYSGVPHHLRKELSMCRTRKWQDVGEINLESFLDNIPLDLKTKIKRHFCKKLFYKVENFEELNSIIKKELRAIAKPVVFQARTSIHQEGYPIYEMIHIVQGSVLAFSNNDAKAGLPAKELKKKDSFGEELLVRALESPLPKLPLATQTIQSVTKVEAFALSFGDFSRVFTKYGGKFIEAYREEWAAHLITGALRKKAALEKWKKSF